MARPSFRASTGEDRVPLHLNLRQSQYDHLCQKAFARHTSKAEIVRLALDSWLHRDGLVLDSSDIKHIVNPPREDVI